MIDGREMGVESVKKKEREKEIFVHYLCKENKC
jgi:hypothetical protein